MGARIKLIRHGWRYVANGIRREKAQYWEIMDIFHDWETARLAMDKATLQDEIALHSKHQARPLKRFRYALQQGEGANPMIPYGTET